MAGATPAAPPPAGVRAEIAAALGHLVGAPGTAAALAPYVQGMDAAMAGALARGAVNSQADNANLLPGGTVRTSAVRATSATVATVDFAITGSGYTDRFVGTAIRSDGRWKVTWVTACMLVEQEGVICPNPPAGVSAPSPLPYSLSDRLLAAAEAPDLLRPQALAMTAHGDVLIADSARDQILEWQPSGRLQVYAGTGQPGFSGDGGPAVHARLEGPGAMTMSPSGTLYFVDGARVRAISAKGIITTVAGNGKPGPARSRGRALAASLNPSGIAIAKSGTLYIANNSEILKVSPSGALSSFVKGGPPYGVDVSTPEGKMAFFPASMAFDGAGDLDVFSSSPKELFQFSPTGRLKDLGGYYATELSAAPNGDVVVGGHGGMISVVTPKGAVKNYFDLLTMKIAGYGVPGMRGGFQPDGVAVAPSGAIFVDTFSGNGWTQTTSLAEIEPNRTAHELAITTPVLATLPALGGAGFPASTYPAPAEARGVDLSACPASQGLRAFNASSTAAARRVAAQFNAFTSSFYGDLRSSDRSWWEGLFGTWSGAGYDLDTHTVVSVGPASRDTFSAAVAPPAANGSSRAQSSWWSGRRGTRSR